MTVDDVFVHDENAPEPSLSYILGRMQYPAFPVPMGVFRALTRPTYEELMAAQISTAIAKKGLGDLEKLLNSGETWVVS